MVYTLPPNFAAFGISASGIGDANVKQLLGTAHLAPTVAGTPDVNAKQVGGQTATASGTVTFPNAMLASTTNITAGTITTTTNLTTNNDKTGYGLSAPAIQAIWDAATSALTTAGSVGKAIVDTLATLLSRITGAVMLGSAYTAPDNTSAQAAAASASSADGKASTLITNVAAVPTALLDFASGVETNLTVRQWMRATLALQLGISTDIAGTYVIKRKDGTTTAVTITHDSSGNRSAVTYGSL